MKRVALAKVKDDISRYLRQATAEQVVITRQGRAAGVLIGFDSEDAWFEYRPEHHPEFQAQIARARESLRQGKGVRLEDVKPRLADYGLKVTPRPGAVHIAPGLRRPRRTLNLFVRPWAPCAPVAGC